MKFKVGDSCTSISKDTYVILKTDSYKPISVVLIDSPHDYNRRRLGMEFTSRDNQWEFIKIGDKITKLEKIIYGVKFEDT